MSFSIITKIGTAGRRVIDALLRRRAAAASRRYGIEGYVTGETALNVDASAKIAAGLPSFVALVVVFALLLLLAVFRSVPVTAVAGFLLTIVATLGLSTFVFEKGHLVGPLGTGVAAPVVSSLPVLVVAVLFGLAMDYEVLLVSRIREAHLKGHDPLASIHEGFAANARVVTWAALIMGGVFAAFPGRSRQP